MPPPAALAATAASTEGSSSWPPRWSPLGGGLQEQNVGTWICIHLALRADELEPSLLRLALAALGHLVLCLGLGLCIPQTRQGGSIRSWVLDIAAFLPYPFAYACDAARSAPEPEPLRDHGPWSFPPGAVDLRAPAARTSSVGFRGCGTDDP